MRKYTLFAFALLFVVATFTGSAKTQQPIKTDEQIAADTPISIFIPDDAVAAKLTAEEQTALKLHLTKLMAFRMRVAYQAGAKASSDFMLKEFARQVAEAQNTVVYYPNQPGPSKLDKLAAVLQGISQGAAAASQKRLDCVSNRVGSSVYTNCYEH